MRRRAALAAFLLVGCSAACAAELGTLFHSPEERARLDRLRRGEPAETPRAAQNRTPTVTGFVKRSDGRNTVWIDGRPQAMGGDPAKMPEARRPETPAIEIRRTK